MADVTKLDGRNMRQGRRAQPGRRAGLIQRLQSAQSAQSAQPAQPAQQAQQAQPAQQSAVMPGRRRAPGPRPVRRTISKRFRSYVVDTNAQLVPVFLAVIIAVALIYGWSVRNDGYLTPENGAGYWLGIIGAVMMLLLLLYPLRKRLKSMRIIGTVSGWFRLHMLLGVLGPLLIIVHANFKLGSLNSAVALLSMLSVAISGLIGRYFYSRIHQGLYGQKAEIRAILADAHQLKAVFGADLSNAPAITDLLERFEHKVLVRHPNIFKGISATIALRRQTRLCRHELLKHAKHIVNRNGRAVGLSWRQRRKQMREVKDHLEMYFRAVRKAARLALFERLFSLWHVAHLPLFVILVFAAIVHVIAVHLY